MSKLEDVMNRKLVRALFNHYTTSGIKRMNELFGAPKERSVRAAIGRIPVKTALNIGMKKIGITEEMKEIFFTRPFNKQLVLNVMATIGKYGLKQPFRFDAPLVIVWNYTNVCNLRCRYCYQSAGKPAPDELTFEEKIQLINQMVEAHVAFIAFSGGEPILGPRFWDVLEYASRFLHTSIASNGTLLGNKDLVTRIADCGARNVFVSLDGATAEPHDFIRGEGSFDRTIDGIRNLVANAHLHVGINMVVTKRNYDEVPRVLERALDLGVNSFNHYNFIPTGRGKEDYDQDLTPEQREDLMSLLYDWHSKRKETGLNIISTSPTFARVIYERSHGTTAGMFHYTSDKADQISGIIEYAGGCGAGRVYAAMQPNGLMSPCVFMPDVIIGDVRKQRFIDIWRNSKTCKKMTDRSNYEFSCPQYQTMCGGCRARAYAYGNLIGPDPGCIVYKKLHDGIKADRNREEDLVESIA
jgi:MoaA/NifB/PqqE/SkfB family radical SAM enzyme